MRITFAIKKSFFDTPAIEAAIGRARVRSLSKAGSFVRRRARSSMRRRKQSSAPGSPPSAHSSSGPSLKTILFAYDRQSDGVIVGPVLLNEVTESISGFRTTMPGLHERGETASILESRWVPIGPGGEPSPWRQVDRRRKKRPRSGFKIEARRRIAKYPARPFMAPALAAEAPNFPDLFKDSIRK